MGSLRAGLKRIEDATEVRRRLLTAPERAEATQAPEERQALLTFLIVGGGPTGVELAGAIAELARYGMEKEFRHFDPASARVILVQSGPKILPTFPEGLSEHARRALETLGVEVRVNSRVQEIDAAKGNPCSTRSAQGPFTSEAASFFRKRVSPRSVPWLPLDLHPLPISLDLIKKPQGY